MHIGLMYAALVSASEITPDGRLVSKTDGRSTAPPASTSKDDRQDALFPPCPIAPEVEVSCSARDRVEAMAS